MERYSYHIWVMEEDQGWRLMDISMGAAFDGYSNNTVLVPDTTGFI